MSHFRIWNVALAFCLIRGALGPVLGADHPGAPADRSVLPFLPGPSASIAGPALQESKHVRRHEPHRLLTDTPNILIVLLDDVGFGQSAAFGGEIKTPILSLLRDEGISYNAFHTKAISSLTRAVLLIRRNHQRVGSMY